jgi:anti-sigma B factor antagonist
VAIGQVADAPWGQEDSHVTPVGATSYDVPPPRRRVGVLMDDIVAWDQDDTPTIQDVFVYRRETAQGVVLCVAGELDMVTAPEFSDRLNSELAQTDGPVILDLGGVTFMSTAGINALLRADELAGPRLRVRAMRQPVRRVLELTALLGRFPIIT